MPQVLKSEADIAAFFSGVVPRSFDKPAPSEQVQRAAYVIHGATADMLQAIQDVTDFHAAMEMWERITEATNAVMAIQNAIQAKAEAISRNKE